MKEEMFLLMYNKEDVVKFPKHGVLFYQVPEDFDEYELDEAYLSLRTKFHGLEEVVVYVNDNNTELVVELIKITTILKKRLTFIWPNGRVQQVLNKEDDLRTEFKYNIYRCVELWKDLLSVSKDYYSLRSDRFVEIIFDMSVEEMLNYYGDVVDVRTELYYFDEFTKEGYPWNK